MFYFNKNPIIPNNSVVSYGFNGSKVSCRLQINVWSWFPKNWEKTISGTSRTIYSK